MAATYTFNPLNWLRCLTSVLGAAVVASFDYDGALAAQAWPAETRLSPTGQRRAMMETVGTATRTVAYGYDLLSRLTKEDIQAATASPTALVAYDGTGTGQGYDRVGNRRSRQVTGTLPGVSTYTGHTFSERDLLNPNPQTGYTYDLNGNTTADPSGAAYAYDAENRLVKVTQPDGTTITLAYDADGNRVKKVVHTPGTANDSTTLYLVDDRNPTGYAQVIEERDAAGATTVTYTYGLDLVSQRRGTKVSYYGYDGLGSVRYLTDESGAVTDTYTYDAFGILIGLQVLNGGVLEPVTPLNQQLSTLNYYCYTGEQWDGDLDLYYLRARYYEPQLGRFCTMDTYEGSQNDPLSLHKYLYAHGNPINMVDPSGHDGNFISTMFTMTKVAGLAAVRTLGLHTVRGKVVAAFGAAAVGGNEIYWRTRGSAPTPQERAQIKAAIALVASTGGYKDYADTAADLSIRLVETGETAEAGHVPVAWEVMLLWKEATNWEPPILASVIVHEAAHSDQWVNVGTKWHEAEAYQAQSDFLRAVGVSGKTDDLRGRFPKADDYFLDLAEAFRKYCVQNPAVH